MSADEIFQQYLFIAPSAFQRPEARFGNHAVEFQNSAYSNHPTEPRSVTAWIRSPVADGERGERRRCQGSHPMSPADGSQHFFLWPNIDAAAATRKDYPTGSIS